MYRTCSTAPLRQLLLIALAVSIRASAVGAADAPLLEAARNADADRVRALLRPGNVDVNARQGDGATALHWAAHRDAVEIADLLLKAGAAVNATNALGVTPLWLASANGSAAMVERLLEAGANPNAALESGETPLMTAARTGNVAAVRLLVRRGADVNASERLRGQTALMWAADQRHAEVARALIESGADVHARSAVWHQLENTAGNTNPTGNFEMAHGGSTPLLFAARQGDRATARVLLDGGANVNDTVAAGMSALVVAAHSGHGPLAAYLLEKGADPNASGAGYTALHAAVLRGDLQLVTVLLDRGANVNALVTHGTPSRRFSADYHLRHQMIGVNAFWLAARYGEVAIMKELAARGADPLVVPKDETTALIAAMGYAGGVTENRQYRWGVTRLQPEEEERITLEAARLAVELGADVTAANASGDTALHDAARQTFNSVIQFLVDRGADVNARNKRGDAPLALALAEGREATVADPRRDERIRTAGLLRKLGAKD